MNEKNRQALATLVYEAIRFADLMAGEGICPADEADARDPADFLFEYVEAIGCDTCEGLAAKVRDAMLNAAALEGSVALPAWQPIETAPKDGTEIIGIYYMDWSENYPPTVYGPWTVAFRNRKWESSWDRSEVISYMGDFRTEYKEPDCDPTHWQPMPPAITRHQRAAPGTRSAEEPQ